MADTPNDANATPEAQRGELMPGGRGRATPPPPPPAAQDPEPEPTPVAPPPRKGSLADYLERTRRHPVIVFETGASGKSTMLMSLIQALNRSNSVNIFLGDPIFPKEHPEARAAHEQAVVFFEREAQAFTMGQKVPATRVDRPYFIPVDIERKSDGRVVRFALLEGKGEWYAPIHEGTGSLFPQFKDDIADIMALYGESLSVVWMAPYSIGDGKDHDTQDSDLALVGAINEYRKRRLSVGQDFHLFLFTKWDCFAEPLADKPNFSVVTPDMVEDLIEERYPNTWPKYEGLALNSHGRRFFMQFASGHIVGDTVRVPPQRHRAAFDRYPRTVWNWLYGNATEAEMDNDARARETLFGDVIAEPPRPVPLMRRLSLLLLGR